MEGRLYEALEEIPGHKEKRGFFPEETLHRLVNEDSVR